MFILLGNMGPAASEGKQRNPCATIAWASYLLYIQYMLRTATVLMVLRWKTDGEAASLNQAFLQPRTPESSTTTWPMWPT